LLREGKTKIIGTITKIISWEKTGDSFYILMICICSAMDIYIYVFIIMKETWKDT
jgi:hypothetical protein